MNYLQLFTTSLQSVYMGSMTKMTWLWTLWLGCEEKLTGDDSLNEWRALSILTQSEDTQHILIGGHQAWERQLCLVCSDERRTTNILSAALCKHGADVFSDNLLSLGTSNKHYHHTDISTITGALVRLFNSPGFVGDVTHVALQFRLKNWMWFCLWPNVL